METNFTEINCTVCNNANPLLYTTLYYKSNLNVVECQTCGFIFIPPYYRKQITYTQYKNKDVADIVRKANNWVKIERHKIRYNLIKKYKKPGSTLFDLGSGWGHFMLTGNMLGYHTTGIEIAEQPYLYSKQDLQLNVQHINFFDYNTPHQFDIITMWDVLEHIDDANSVIKKCAAMQSSKGIIVIQVPQIDSYFAKKYKDQWKMMGLDHVNYFGKKTITKLLAHHGYTVLTIKSSFEIKLFLMYTLLPWAKKIKTKFFKTTTKSSNTINTEQRQQYYNNITTKPLWQLKLMMKIHNLIYYTLEFFNVGEEMIVVAQKK